MFFDAVPEVVQRLSKGGLVPPYEVSPQHQLAQLSDVRIYESSQQSLDDRPRCVHLNMVIGGGFWFGSVRLYVRWELGSV